MYEMYLFFYHDIVFTYLRMCNELIGKLTTWGIFVIVQALLFSYRDDTFAWTGFKKTCSKCLSELEDLVAQTHR